MGDPEDTAPFTHRPYGEEGAGPADNPFVPPSGPAYVQPPVPPPPSPGGAVGPPYGPPYGPPVGQDPWQHPWARAGAQPWAPAYAAPYAGSPNHQGATTSLVLGIVSVVSLLGTFVCCLTLPGVLCAPFAWWTGARAKREIERTPGVYANLSAAQAGMWIGAVVTFLGLLVVAALVVLVVWFSRGDLTQV